MNREKPKRKTQKINKNYVDKGSKLKSLCKKCGEIENGDYCDCNEELTYEEKQKILMDNYDGGRCGWR